MQNAGVEWRPPYQQPHSQASTSSPHPGYDGRSAGPTSYGRPSQPSIGFTPRQLELLRNQILAFRSIKAGERVPPEVLALTKGLPPPRVQQAYPPAQQQLPAPQVQRPALQPQPAIAPAHLRPFMPPTRPYGVPMTVPPGLQPVHPAALSRPSTGQLPAPAPAPAPAPGPQSAASLVQPPPQVPAASLKGPLYTLASGMRAPPPMTISEGLLSQKPQEQHLNYSVAALMKQECDKMVGRRISARTAELEQMLQTKATCPGFLRVGGKLPRGSIMLELRRLRALGLQEQLRAQVEKEQAEIMGMTLIAYRKFARNCQSNRYTSSVHRVERTKTDLSLERVRAVKAWRSLQQERLVQERDSRVQRNRHVMRAHERMSRQHSKLKDDDRTRRMDALRANDFEAYQELLREQGADETQGVRYEVITKFLNDTEEYLHKLAGKVSNVKLQQEASEAFTKATAEARAMGFTEEEVLAAANQAAKDAAASSQLQTQSQLDQGDAQSRYYSLAHSVEEVVKQQPAMLQGPFDAKLREYQLVGLQWMVSLYNNRLNGILADEMGLGKTVQVMALLAYLMENKNVFGPHLIIVPNAVIVNWKAELTQWLPNVRCVYYVGTKDERSRKYAAEVQSLQFNVLVTTYEFIMRDRAKLSKVEWKYVIIDEAQRMKDRQSKLAKDLDRFSASRRLLLTGTPLQNELRELWSLLNLLLPEVFDDKSTFTEWFGDSLGKAADGGAKQEDEWLETEKRVVVIHRLHQILEPFMLRRQVEDVESKLPPKVAVVVKVAMSPYQSVIYTWVKATGTLRNDPDNVVSSKSFRKWANLNNKCMELRKVCNHPALSYQPMYVMEGGDLVRQCGKFAVLDRMLTKLHATGHRVLLFSTMTRLLDLLEQYLRWRTVGPERRHMGFLRIDGSTSLDDREKAIKHFNRPDSDAFIFLLSIRAAGRGLNLQSADTVVIYDPDPNPKNEEQAIARSHRIGQTKEVRIFHLEAVADAPPSASQEGRAGRPSERTYADSIESLVRNNIQKTKIDMANEVIDAGRFNMATTQEERKETLEALLQDEERMKKAVNKVPTAAELNRMLARNDKEVEIFDKMDAQPDWPTIPSDLSSVPRWLIPTAAEVAEAVASNSKVRLSANAEMAAAAARHKPMEANRRARAVPGQYAEQDPEDADFFVEASTPHPEHMALGEASGSRSAEVSVLVDNDDMEEEDIDGNVQGLTPVKSELSLHAILPGGVQPKQEGKRNVKADVAQARAAKLESLPTVRDWGAGDAQAAAAEQAGPSVSRAEPSLPRPGSVQPLFDGSAAAGAEAAFANGEREHKQKKKKKRKDKDRDRDRKQDTSGAAEAGRQTSLGTARAANGAAGQGLEASSTRSESQPQKKMKLTISFKRKAEDPKPEQ